MNNHLRFGIEEEYFITELASRRMSAQPPGAAIRACQSAIGSYFALEMFQGQIEVASPIFSSVTEAAHYLDEARASLRHALEPHGLGLLSVGSHPLADWRAQRATDQPHFCKLFEDYRHVAQRSVLSGLHVHVEVPNQLDRIQVMNEVLPWTPLLLALSCSSPFWDGADSGYLSYRQTACDEWPRMGIPEFFSDQPAYEAYVGLLMQTGAIKQPGDCWWGIRPAAKYPTLELRMTDACPRVDDALCLASFFRLLVAYAIEHPQPGTDYTQHSRWILMENRWRAKRYGVEAEFVIEGYDRAFTTGQWLFRAQQILGRTAHQMGVGDVFRQLRRMVAGGTSAQRQLGVFQRALNAGEDRHAGLTAVVDHLMNETAKPSRFVARTLETLNAG